MLEKHAVKNEEKEENAHRIIRILDIMDEIVSWGTALEDPILGDDEKVEVKFVKKEEANS